MEHGPGGGTRGKQTQEWERSEAALLGGLGRGLNTNEESSTHSGGKGAGGAKQVGVEREE